MRRPIAGDVWIREEGSDIDTFREVVSERVYEEVTRRIPDCRYVIDLGANIGLATRFFAARYPGCRILAVEPHEGNFAVLERNVAGLVEQGRCRTLQAAVWDHRSRLAVAAPSGGEDRYSGMFVREASGDDTRCVDAVTMPELIERSGFPAVDILKVDIEGAEAGLFRGDAGWLERVRAIAIEFHGDSRQRSGFDGVMERRGFAVHDRDAHTVVAVRPDSCPRT
jgi:FkbM family methyltransferase